MESEKGDSVQTGKGEFGWEAATSLPVLLLPPFMSIPCLTVLNNHQGIFLLNFIFCLSLHHGAYWKTTLKPSLWGKTKLIRMWSHGILLRKFTITLKYMAPWSVACQAPLSLEFSRQEHWSGLPFLTPGDLSDTGMEPMSLASPELAVRLFTTGATYTAI